MKFGERDWAEVEAVSLPAPLPAMLEDLDDDAHFALRRHIVELMWEVERLREQDMHQRADIDLNATLRAELDRVRGVAKSLQASRRSYTQPPMRAVSMTECIVSIEALEALDTKEVAD